MLPLPGKLHSTGAACAGGGGGGGAVGSAAALAPTIETVQPRPIASASASVSSRRSGRGPQSDDADAAHHATILPKLAADPRFEDYMRSVRAGLVFYVRPHQSLVVSDGVRAGVEWEEVLRIDGMVKLLLEMFDVPYIPIDCLPMQERVRLLERVLSLAGAEKHVPRPKVSVGRKPEGNGESNGNGNGNGHSRSEASAVHA